MTDTHGKMNGGTTTQTFKNDGKILNWMTIQQTRRENIALFCSTLMMVHEQSLPSEIS
jgi:hypothetical protein